VVVSAAEDTYRSVELLRQDELMLNKDNEHYLFYGCFITMHSRKCVGL